MLLLVFVTIYIYKQYSQLAIQKGLNKTRWGLIGSGLYLGLGLGLQLFIGVLIGLGYLSFDLENTASNFLLDLICYALGGIAAYLGYQKLKSFPDEAPNIDDFGKNQEDRY